MKRVILFLTVLVLATNIGFTAEKHILLEEFTSAKCGWCVDGFCIMDSLIKKYPQYVIGIEQHTSDGMMTEQSSALYTAFGQWGTPSASINRLDFTGKVPSDQGPYLIGRENWFSLVQNLLNETPTSDVSCSWYYDETAKQIKGLVTSSLLKDLPYQQTLNATIIENNVTGTGDLFDQLNYYSKLKGYEKHPYYNLPSVLEGFQHKDVVRLSVGGLWGEKLNIKKPGYIGESYQWSFCIDVPKPLYGNPLNINNVDMIGISAIDETNNSEILNCAKGTKEIPKTSFLYSTNGYTHFINDTLKINMKIDNFTVIDNHYEVVIENIGYGAKNWNINFDKSTFAINSGESSSFNIVVIPKSQGMKKFRVVLKDKDNSTFYTFSEITVYNKDTEKFIITDPDGSTSSNLDELSLANYNDFIWLTSNQTDAMQDSFPNSKLFIIDNSDYIALSDYSSEQFNTLTNKGKKLFIMGNGMGAMTKSYPKLMTFWAGMGFKFNEEYTKFDETVNNSLSIKGYKGDPISDESQMILIPTKRNKEYSTFGISDYNIARPVYSITKDPNSIISFRTILNNQRVLFSALNFFNIQDKDLRYEYINKSINWLLDGLGEDQPHLIVSTKNLNYNLVPLGKSDTLGITYKNIGNRAVQLTSQTIVNKSSEYFAVQPLTPKTINPGDSTIYQIRFTPLSKVQAKGYFYVKVNDPYRDSVAVTMSGTGRASVENDLSLQSSITTSPNPITQSAWVTVIFDNNMLNVKVNLIDATGRLIKQISSGDFLKGTYNFNLTTNDLNSGAYFIQLTNDINTLCQPVIINK